MKACSYLAAFSLLAVISGAEAGEILWQAKNTQWNDPQNWTGGVVPGPSDTARFAGSNFTQIDLGANTSVRRIFIADRLVAYPPPYGSGGYTDHASAYTLGIGPVNSQTLTLLDGGGISSSGYYGQTLTINARVVLGETGGQEDYYITGPGAVAGTAYLNGQITGGAGGERGKKTLSLTSVSTLAAQVYVNGSISDGGSSQLAIKLSGGGSSYQSAIHFNAQNSYSGETVLYRNLDLFLNVADAISAASEIVFAEDTVSERAARIRVGDFDQNLGVLTMSAKGALSFDNINADVAFLDSHLSLWTGVLNVENFQIGQNTLRFGTDSSGLTADQLSRIVKSGYTAGIDDDGYIVFTPVAVPEAGTLALIGLGLGVLGVGFVQRRKK